ncbi:hypothetical protein [Pseudoclavibacter sp. 13-3]|uniref:hypothetical protein n=1 Tax=Pseudoclavibacter sp. 13-3 TaxID=2901228 RepID=UPI001E331A17|nr:hypothetical protein [Pseudoclavibacter sp. 13-3]MCD7102074.1 hypothetical protein [Pseudoclavibacter sp. 13-3]
MTAATNAGSDARDQLRAGSHAFLYAVTDISAIRILFVDAPAALGWQEWRRLDEENAATHLRSALHDLGVADDLLDASTAQLSGAMNEAALWIAQQENIEAARMQSHAALDRLFTAYLLTAYIPA